MGRVDKSNVCHDTPYHGSKPPENASIGLFMMQPPGSLTAEPTIVMVLNEPRTAGKAFSGPLSKESVGVRIGTSMLRESTGDDTEPVVAIMISVRFDNDLTGSNVLDIRGNLPVAVYREWAKIVLDDNHEALTLIVVNSTTGMKTRIGGVQAIGFDPSGDRNIYITKYSVNDDIKESLTEQVTLMDKAGIADGIFGYLNLPTEVPVLKEIKGA